MEPEDEVKNNSPSSHHNDSHDECSAGGTADRLSCTGGQGEGKEKEAFSLVVTLSCDL